LEYGGSGEDGIGDNLPNFTLENVTLQNYSGGELDFEMKAKSARVFDKKNETSLEEVTFIEYTPEGEITSQGKGESVVFFGKTDSAEMDGPSEFRSIEDESTISSDYLYWDGSKKRLFSKDEMEVSVQREDGSSFTGKGFEADMKLGILRFENGVQGTLEVNDEE
jgi:LPS export ABC transporter protein LptC